MRLALSQSCLPGLSTQVFLEVAAEAGATGCELGVIGGLRPPEDPKVMASAARGSRLRVESVNALRDWALPDDSDWQPAFELLLESAVEMGAPWILCVAPIRFGGMPPRAEVIASASERLASLADTAAQAGVGVALEQVGLSSTQPGATSGIPSLADALAIVEAAGPTTALVLDSYNLATGGNTFEDVARVPPERIAVAQLADGVASGSPRSLPGEGELPLQHYVDALGAAGFDGALSVEIFPERPPADPLEFARRAVRAAGELLPD